jgi:hypothetical protein
LANDIRHRNNRQKISRRDHLQTRSTADVAIDNVFANGYRHKDVIARLPDRERSMRAAEVDPWWDQRRLVISAKGGGF